jgi:hypothetical protein
MSEIRKESVSPDTVYSQLYANLRSHREHELRVTTWFTMILLTILASVIAGKYAASGSPLGVALERCPSLKWFLAAVPILLGVAGAWLIADAMRQHRAVGTKLRIEFGTELPGENATEQTRRTFLKPGTLMCAVLLFLGVFTAILIVHKPSLLG